MRDTRIYQEIGVPLDFAWDQAKATANVFKHKVSFREATAIFLDASHIEFDVSRTEDGEVRRKAVGEIEGRLFSVVYTERGEVRRIISARRANSSEEKLHGNRPLQT